MNRLQMISCRMRRYLENGGNFRRILAERNPAQALNLPRGKLRSVFAEYLDHHPAMKPVGDLDQFGLHARQKFRPSFVGSPRPNDEQATVTGSTRDRDRVSVWADPVRKGV